MYIDFKITTWERVKTDNEQVINGLKDGNITCAGEIFDVDSEASCEKMAETDEQISPEENGAATIEIYTDKGELLWDNEVAVIEKPKKLFLLFNTEDVTEEIEDIKAITNEKFLELSKEYGIIYTSELAFVLGFNQGEFSTETHQLRIIG